MGQPIYRLPFGDADCELIVQNKNFSLPFQKKESYIPLEAAPTKDFSGDILKRNTAKGFRRTL